MTSTRLKSVYNTAAWQRLRLDMIRLAGGRCTWRDPVTRVRCSVIDKNYGGTQSLTVDHTNEHAHPLDPRFLKVLCRRHHGIKDGGKRIRRQR